MTRRNLIESISTTRFFAGYLIAQFENRGELTDAIRQRIDDATDSTVKLFADEIRRIDGVRREVPPEQASTVRYTGEEWNTMLEQVANMFAPVKMVGNGEAEQEAGGMK